MLKAKLTCDEAEQYDVTWTSSDASAVTVDAEGNASAYVTVSGEKDYANGYVYLDYEDQNISGCSMVTEKGEQLELQFGEKIGDAINYFGTMSIILAAG